MNNSNAKHDTDCTESTEHTDEAGNILSFVRSVCSSWFSAREFGLCEAHLTTAKLHLIH